MSTDFSALQRAADEQHADADILSENKVDDLVTIANANVVGNQQQVVIGHLALMTGWLYDLDTNVNTILTGPSAAGKSEAQRAMRQALPSDLAYETSDASSMGVLDDDSWDKAIYAPLDEWQKVPDKLTEILKGVAGGPDDEYRYVRSVSDEDAASGRSAHEIVKKPKPFQFLYAQHGLDHELSTRLVFLPIDDNTMIRDAIIEKQGGAENIAVEGYEKDFIFDAADRERALRDHIRSLPTIEGEGSNIRGGVDATLPPWIRKSVKPIFDKSRPESNRVAGQIFNLIRASAALNYDQRRSITVEMDGHELDSYIATAQDAANVLSARETLLAKTHHLTQMKRQILDAIRSNQHFEDANGVTIDVIRNYLEDSAAVSVPRKQKLRDLLNELAEHFYVTVHERAGPNGAHLYEFQSLRDIGMPRVTNLAQYMDSAEQQKNNELAPNVDLDDPYAGTTDPFRDQPFVDTVSEMRDEFAANPVERAAETADLAAEQATGTRSGNDDGDKLTLAEAAGADTADDADPTAGRGPVETAVLERLQAHADDEIWNVDTTTDGHLIGVLEEDETLAEADLTGTMYDPDHEVWDDPRKPDDWVVSQEDAEREIEQAINELEQDGLLVFQTDAAGADNPVVDADGYVVTQVAGA